MVLRAVLPEVRRRRPPPVRPRAVRELTIPYSAAATAETASAESTSTSASIATTRSMPMSAAATPAAWAKSRERPVDSLHNMATNDADLPDLGEEIARRARLLADAADNLRTAEGFIPLSGGTLMTELDHEREFSADDPWGPDPVMAARNLASMALVAAIDYLRAFALTVEVHQTYAPFLTSRAVLEACSVASYLGEHGIGTRERVRRVMNERLLELHGHIGLIRDTASAEGAPELTESEDRVRLLVEIASGFGFNVVDDGDWRPFALDSRWPSATALIDQVFPGGLGKMLYHVTSSPSHSRAAGLLKSAKLGPETPFGPQMAHVGLTERDATTLNSACVLAFGPTVTALARMNGWSNEAWKQLFDETRRFAQTQRTAHEVG